MRMVQYKFSRYMSLFYGKKDDDNQYPQIEPHAQEPPKKNNDQTFKKKNQGGPRDSVFISRQKQPEKQPGWCDKCCACLSLDYYKDYFKVTNQDVVKRIGCNLKFWSGGFFKPQQQDYDLYGPFWLYTTMIFIVGAIRNVLVYENSNTANYKYDFQIISVAMTVFYGLGLGLSAIIGLIFGCMGLSSKTSQIVCLYGYSMATYIICVLLCTVNMTLMTWLFLLYGAGSKIAFILKNIFELEVPTAKKFMITLIVIIQAGVQFLIIKFAFIKTSSDGSFTGGFSHMSSVHDSMPELDGIMHFRQFQPHL